MYFEVNEAEQEQTEHRIGDFPLAIYHRILERTRNDGAFCWKRDVSDP